MNKMDKINKLTQWLSFKLPKRLVYFAAMRLIAHATSGKYGNQIVPELKAMDAMGTWEADFKLFE